MKKKIVIMGMAVLLLGLPCSACQTLEKEAAGAEADAEREVCGAGRDCRYGDQ